MEKRGAWAEFGSNRYATLTSSALARRSSAAMDGTFNPRSTREIYPRVSSLRLARRSSVRPFSVRTRRRLRPNPAVRLTSSKANLLHGHSRPSNCSASDRRLAPEPPPRQRSIRYPAWHSIRKPRFAGIFNTNADIVSRAAKNTKFLPKTESFSISCRFRRHSPVFAVLISLSKHDRFRARIWRSKGEGHAASNDRPPCSLAICRRGIHASLRPGDGGGCRRDIHRSGRPRRGLCRHLCGDQEELFRASRAGRRTHQFAKRPARQTDALCEPNFSILQRLERFRGADDGRQAVGADLQHGAASGRREHHRPQGPVRWRTEERQATCGPQTRHHEAAGMDPASRP